jgi:hypothetical protein
LKVCKLSPVSAELEQCRAARQELSARPGRQTPRGLKIEWTRKEIKERDC